MQIYFPQQSTENFYRPFFQFRDPTNSYPSYLRHFQRPSRANSVTFKDPTWHSYRQESKLIDVKLQNLQKLTGNEPEREREREGESCSSVWTLLHWVFYSGDWLCGLLISLMHHSKTMCTLNSDELWDTHAGSTMLPIATYYVEKNIKWFQVSILAQNVSLKKKQILVFPKLTMISRICGSLFIIKSFRKQQKNNSKLISVHFQLALSPTCWREGDSVWLIWQALCCCPAHFCFMC